MKKKCAFIASIAIMGIVLVAVGIWIMFDSLTGGQGRWYYLLPPAIAYVNICISLYQYLKEEKSEM